MKTYTFPFSDSVLAAMSAAQARIQCAWFPRATPAPTPSASLRARRLALREKEIAQSPSGMRQLRERKQALLEKTL